MAAEYIRSVTNGDGGLLRVGYNMSAGSPTRVWAEEKSIALVKKILAHNSGCHVILITTPSERKRAIKLKEQVGGNIDIVPDKLNLTEAAAMIRHLDILISPDTSLVHIARALKVPVVGLYSRYMKNFLLWRPYGQQTGAVVSGCDENIFDITVDQVYHTFVDVANQQKLGKQ